MKYPEEVQQENLKRIISQSKDTVFGNKYQFSSMGGVREFQERVPVVNYEGLYPFIERSLKGEPNVLWPTEVRWFAKSSGTTNARSKFIPEDLANQRTSVGHNTLGSPFNDRSMKGYNPS